MERLTGLDASFLYMETSTSQMHTLKLAVIDPGGMTGDVSAGRFIVELGRRLHLSPYFRRRIVEVPGRLHHPVWIEDPDFDLANHVRRYQVAAPGGRREMDDAIAAVCGRKLDRSRPLWELWILEGLEGGRVGLLVKMHHAVADGVAAANQLLHLASTSPAEPSPDPAEWSPDPLPSRRRLIRHALADHRRQLRRLPALVARSLRARRAVAARRRWLGVELPSLLRGSPRTRFNRVLPPERSFATASLSFDDARMVTKAFGVTINDLILALTSGALRSYLLDREGLPAATLSAGVPVSTERVDPAAAPRLRGNRWSYLMTHLGTHLADPVERLRYIHEHTAAAKEIHRLHGDLLEAWWEYLPPALVTGVMRLYSRLRLADRLPAMCNVGVSNVPGPRSDLYIAGGEISDFFSVGPLADGVGLNITVWSYAGRLNIGALSSPDIVPDVHVLTDYMEAALVELVKEAEALTGAAWMANNTPASKEAADALARFAPDACASGGASLVWTAGKLPEAGAPKSLS